MNGNDAFPHAAFLAIAGMAAATYLMRVGGFWLMGHVPLSPRMQRMLEALPGCVVTAIVLPVMVRNGMPAVLAISAVVAAMVATRNTFLAMAVGLAAAALARAGGL